MIKREQKFDIETTIGECQVFIASQGELFGAYIALYNLHSGFKKIGDQIEAVNQRKTAHIAFSEVIISVKQKFQEFEVSKIIPHYQSYADSNEIMISGCEIEAILGELYTGVKPIDILTD